MYRRVATILPRRRLLPGWKTASTATWFSKNNKLISTSTICLADEKTGRSLPSETRVVICGGGVVGASVAYHLAEKGWKDVVLLEQGSLTCGTTWHSAGMIGRTRHNPVEMKLIDYSSQLYDRLEKEEYGTGWKECGSLNVARTNERLIDFKRHHDVAETVGVETHIVDAAEISRRCPLLRTDDLVGGIWIPQDGVTNPSDVCMALSKVARENGVQVFEKVTVDQVLTENGKVKSVKTSLGDIRCEIFVNCSGQWARALGQKTVPEAVDVPIFSCEHFYFVTKPLEGIDRMMPVVRDYDGYAYLREWNGGICGGGFEPHPKTCFHNGIPEKFEYQLFEEDWDQFEDLHENILHRMPSLETAEVRQLINGPESFTPDTRWFMGQSPVVKNYFIAAGMNSKGIAGAGGIGKYLAEWIVDGEASANLWYYDPRRFIRTHMNKNFLNDRIPEAITAFGSVMFPIREYKTSRNIRCSPLHTRLEASGAIFGESMMYEKALYFTDKDDAISNPHPVDSWSKPSWYESVRAECRACIEHVGIMDLSSFVKIEVKSQGKEATDFLQYLCSSDVDKKVGSVIDTGMQNAKGGFENDCTVARLEANHYFITCLASQQNRAISWLKSHLPADGSVQVTDVTSMSSGIALIGPHAQQLLADVGDISTTKADFKPMTTNVIDVGYASNIRAMRLTHTGEDGFILFIPSEYALHVYDTLMKAGKSHGIRNTGHYALRHLRIENFLADWGPDLDDKSTPLECGQDFTTKLDSKNDFLGKAALLQQQGEGVGRRFTQFVLDDFDVHKDIWPWDGEPIYRNGKYVGLTATCGYGFSQEKMICPGFVGELDEQGNAISQENIDDWVLNEEATYEIVIAGTRFPARPAKIN